MNGSRILVADDHPLSLEGLALAVRHAVPGAIIAVAGRIAEAEEAASQRGGFRLVLLDLLLPDARDFSAILRLQFRLPNRQLRERPSRRTSQPSSDARW
jgi:DNA-binding NarL/FixJ family response regulator